MRARVSVVIITRNDPRIKHTLESLYAQTVPPYEVLIVVDSKEDIAVKLSEEYLTKLPLKLVINNEAPGVGGARAKGVREARGDIVAFIDSDCIASRNWIENITKTFCEDNNIYILAGKTIEIRSYEDIIDNDYHKYYVKREMEAKRFLHFALTENFAFKRAIVNHVGNFDARFRQGGEDSDFCIRLISEGYNILYKPDVVVYHLRRGFKSSIKKAWKDGCSRCHVFMKHRSRVLRDFIIVLFNTLAIIFLLMLIACKLIGIFLPTPIVLSASAWIVLSLMHRLYRAFVESRSLTLSSKIFKSFLAYVSYVAFIFTIVSVLLRTLIYKLKVRL